MVSKVYISVDMEGVSGVVHADHTGRDGKDYDLARRLMTLEANAAIEGALEAGAEEVVVNDSHGTQRNLLPELLDQRAKLITGSPKPQTMMAGLDDTFQAVLCVGYHARAGSEGVLDHTISGRVVHDIQVNGQSQGELGLNVGIAGNYGVPIVLVTGDSTCSAQAQELIPGVEVATVKEPLTRYAARCLSPERAQALIQQQAKRAVERSDDIAPVSHTAPVTIRLQFVNSGMADIAQWVPGVERLDATTVSYTSDNFLEAFQCVRVLILAAGAVG
jgi:D-amino peptidase